MFQCKRRRNRGNSGGKAGHFLIFLLLFSIFIEVFMEIPFCSTEIFGAELINSAQEGKTQVLSGSLAVFEEIELTPQEVLKAQKEIEKSVSARRSAPSARETDEWKKYASTYYYEKLSKAQKIFWDTLDEQCSIFLGGTSDAAADNGSFWLPFVTYQNLTYEQAKQVYQMFRYSNPQYYFFSNSFRKNEEKCIFQLGVLSDFAKGSQRAAANAKIKYQIDEMLTEINGEDTPLKKEKMAHDLICDKVVYDENFDNMAKNRFNQTIYSVLCTDSTVCAGYSQTMMLLMNAAGLDCAMAFSPTHAWNLIYLEGNWQYVDLTWDDQPGGWVYTYFNRSREMMHRMDMASHREEEFLDSYLPELTVDSPVKQTLPPGVRMENGRVVLTSDGNDIYYMLGEEPFRLKKAEKYMSPLPGISGTRITAVTAAEGCFESRQVKTKVCQVDFVLDGTVLSPSQMVLSGEKMKAPAIGDRAGYTFTGWHKDPGCTEPYSFADGVSGSMTLYGRWLKQEVLAPPPVENVYKVMFDSCGGSVPGEQNIKQGGQVQPPAPVRKGYSFQGWYTSKDYRELYDFSRGVTEDLVLYAKWKANTYKVTYKANGGYIGKKSVSSKKVRVTYDKKYGRQPEAKRKGYVFLGWYTKKSGGSKVEDTQIVKITGNKTYYARFTKVKPKKAVISSLKSSAPGKITVKMKKEKTASGYEIRYSLKSSMSGAKKVKTTGGEKTVLGLKKGKTYYVQARMYQRESVSGRVSNGAWSKKLKVTVRKK